LIKKQGLRRRDYMSKEKDKFRRLTVENEDRMAALKKLKGDIMKI